MGCLIRVVIGFIIQRLALKSKSLPLNGAASTYAPRDSGATFG
jgi:hypothetical protein